MVISSLVACIRVFNDCVVKSRIRINNLDSACVVGCGHRAELDSRNITTHIIPSNPDEEIINYIWFEA